MAKLESRRIGPRSTLYAEGKYINTAAKDFEDTEVMLQMVEGMNGPYPWGVQDVIVMPPNFPWAGMEHPNVLALSPIIVV